MIGKDYKDSQKYSEQVAMEDQTVRLYSQQSRQETSSATGETESGGLGGTTPLAEKASKGAYSISVRLLPLEKEILLSVGSRTDVSVSEVQQWLDGMRRADIPAAAVVGKLRNRGLLARYVMNGQAFYMPTEVGAQIIAALGMDTED